MRWLAQWLMWRAFRTPYFHLPGYMNRYWLAPFPPLHGEPEGTDGCYTAKFTRNPFVWLCQRFDISIRVHEILRSDEGVSAEGNKFSAPMYHDHPFSFVSMILVGEYTEVRPMFRHGMYIGEHHLLRTPGSIAFRRYNQWHRILLLDDDGVDLSGTRTVYTLFVAFKWRQKWGYLVQPEYKRYYRDVHAEAAAKLPEIR